MIFCSIVLHIVLLLSAEVVQSNQGKKTPSKDNVDDTKQTFAKLLKTIVKVNEERMQAMDKITRLQDYMYTKNKLKIDDESYDSMEEEDNRGLLAFADLPLLRRTEDKTIARAMCNRFNLETNNTHVWTKQFLKLTCHSHSTRLCVNACKKSVIKLCEKFHCDLNTKRDCITECHENCRNLFGHDEQ